MTAHAFRRFVRIAAAWCCTVAIASCATGDRATTTPDTTTDAPPAAGATTAPPTTGPTTATPNTSGAATTTVAPPTNSATTGQSTISIVDFAFSPASVTVDAGSTVIWTNDDAFDHSVVNRDGVFASSDLAPGDRFAVEFDVPGTYSYVCGIHPSMAATVVVSG